MPKVEKKQFVVIGLGRFGFSLTKALFKQGAEVLVIDDDEDKINEIEPFCTQAVCADATDERVLEKLGIRNLDVAIVCIASDIEASIFVTLTCKQLGVPRVIAKAQNEKHKHVLTKIGADLVFVPEEEMGVKLAASLVKPNMIEILTLTENFRIVEIKTPAKWQNKTLIQLDLRNVEKVSIILIKRGEDIIVTPNGEFVLLPEDILVVAGTTENTIRLSSKATENVLGEYGI